MIVRPVVEAKVCDALGELTVAAYRAIPGAPHDAVADYEDELRGRSRHHVKAGAEVVVAVTPYGTLAGGVTYVPGRTRTRSPSSTIPTLPDSACSPWIPSTKVRERARRSRRGASTAPGPLAGSGSSSSTTKWMTTAHLIYPRAGFERAAALDWEPIPDFLLMAFVKELP